MEHPNWPKCPECKSQQVTIKEFWINHVIIWFPDDPKNEGVLNPGEPYRVHGECEDCGHKWFFRCDGQVKDSWWEVTPPKKRLHSTGASVEIDNQPRDTSASG